MTERAELNPQAKLKSIHDWRASGKKVAMVGNELLVKSRRAFSSLNTSLAGLRSSLNKRVIFI